ncbi:ABC transporter ATP-binding protein [Pontibaca methylaminivorans]|uniref:Amino acid/amide ABC transporter ATP-binding protein 2, HAAT family n=1 Tax=Pontibaca methylaminivorans TaxID=515897 RepID=A0A1R3X0L5_9RHOB|nr:ABC transporter ATP-binding protein [Pontibaca methylaminivorans]SIT82771.1 amino acid/amide ABC transporter ATP-binding protein 2, HAAT family [Pontibaca methylaminivorans]
MTDEALLRLTNLHSGYGKVKIVEDISFAVKRGEILAIIGRNGVGKTTLMRSLIGQIPVHSGTIELAGRPITNLSVPRRAALGMGYVPQGREIFGKLSVAANLELGQGVGAAKELNLKAAFDYFPILEKRLQQPAGSMSGGEQQQLAIARIIVGQPQIMLLDEPSEGVQPSIVQDIGRAIMRLSAERGLTIVIVEQNLSLIQMVADRCLVMDKGQIIAEIPPAALADPETARTYLAI